MGDQLHSKNLLGVLFYFRQGLRNLYPPSLAATAGMDLRLHHPDAAAELFGRFDRLVDAEARKTARRDEAEFSEQLFSLVLVYFHSEGILALGSC